MSDLKINFTVSETDQKILKNEMISIEEWADGALKGVTAHAWKKFQNEWLLKLTNDASFTDAIPSGKTEFVALVTSRADYKDRAARDAENAPA